MINNLTLESPAYIVRPNDKILVDNKPLPKQEETRLWRYYKYVDLLSLIVTKK